jgi:hypothetical protein
MEIRRATAGSDHRAALPQLQYHGGAIADGRVTLSQAPVDQLPAALSGPFDAVLAVNSHGFWPGPTGPLGELRRRMRPGGRIAIASQPRCPGATASTYRKAAREIEALLMDAGYTETLGLDPPVVCVLAVHPGPSGGRPGWLTGQACPAASRLSAGQSRPYSMCHGGWDAVGRAGRRGGGTGRDGGSTRAVGPG